MGRKIEISWESATASEISVAKRCAPTQRGFVRFQSFEFLRAGYSQGEVARLSGRAVRTIRRWIEAFSAKGLDGLALKGGKRSSASNNGMDTPAA